MNGYILSKTNNKCLKISENNELNKYDKCEELILKNNNYYCSRCKKIYSFLNINGEKKCKYLPTLYDYFENYYSDYYYNNNNNNRVSYYENIINELNNDYIYDYYFYDIIELKECQEAINIGTEDNPLYSCIKCYNIYENEKIVLNKNILIKDPNANISFCIGVEEYDLDYCLEGIMKKNGNEVIFSCNKCFENYTLLYDEYLKINYCHPKLITKRCMVKYCKKCTSGNNFVCNECIVSNYVVNSATGACVEKMEIIPAITWKDIFRLEMNGVKEINGREIYGPSLMIRGTTSSLINTNHAFLIFLTFAFKQTGRNRNLQENTKKLVAFCVIEKAVEEKDDDVNLVDYKCIGDNIEGGNMEEYELINIEEGNNDNLLKKSNLAYIVDKTELKHLIYKKESYFTIEDFEKIATFKMYEIKNITSANYNFDFKLDGKINKDLNPVIINGKLEIAEIDNLVADCNFVIELNRNANLNCKLNIEQFNNQKEFTFKTFEIYDDNNNINLAKIDEIVLINEVEENEKKSNKIFIILICVICSVIILGGITGIIVYICYKKKKIKNNNKEKNENKDNEKEGGKNKKMRITNFEPYKSEE